MSSRSSAQLVVDVWVFGAGSDIVETDPLRPLPITAWRLDVEARLRSSTVHTDDLAELYVSAFEHSAANEYFIGASGDNPTVRELGEAAKPGTIPCARVIVRPSGADRSNQ